MKNTWIDGEQYVLISLDTLFQWWEWLDALENEPEQGFYLFQQFLEACENELELNPNFIKKMQEIKQESSIPVNDINDLFYDKEQLDVPFNPRFEF